ncbi:MAG: alpha/beta hydrolase [Mycobacteriales bacterium]
MTAACVPTAGHARADARTAASPTSRGGGGALTSKAALAHFYAQRLAWSACNKGFQCATLRVPLSYADPSGPAISIAVIRWPAADPAAKIGSLVLNPGGPGASGVQFLEQAASSFPAVIHSRFDLVSFDPRGVGASTPIRCLNSHQLDEYVNADPAPTTAAQIASVVAVNKMFAAGCERESGRLLAHVSTLDEARDMDILRAALGDRKLTYLGFSYGTYLGAKYIQLFPTHIRAMVLDGAVDPALTVNQLNATQAEGFETDLNDFVNWCIAQGGCPLGNTASTALAQLHAISSSVAAHPVPGPAGRVLTSGEFFEGLAASLYAPSWGWPALKAALTQIRADNATVMLELSDVLTGRGPNGHYTNEIEANVAINCVDRPSPHSLTTFEQQAAKDARLAPFFGAANAWSSLVCAYWPVPAVEAPHPVHDVGGPTILVVGTTRDPATPYAWARALTSQLGNAELLTWQSDGHTAYLRGSSCIDNAVNAYLLELRLPKRGTVCPAAG